MMLDLDCASTLFARHCLAHLRRSALPFDDRSKYALTGTRWCDKDRATANNAQKIKSVVLAKGFSNGAFGK
jgi:hypothetical protein